MYIRLFHFLCVYVKEERGEERTGVPLLVFLMNDNLKHLLLTANDINLTLLRHHHAATLEVVDGGGLLTVDKGVCNARCFTLALHADADALQRFVHLHGRTVAGGHLEVAAEGVQVTSRSDGRPCTRSVDSVAT